jgi:N-acetylmuramoyl-L-alanine amidase
MRRAAAAALTLLLLLGCSSSSDGGEGDPDATSTTTTSSSTSTTATTTAPPTTTTTAPPLPRVTSDAANALVTASGIVLPVVGGGPGAWRVMTPCAREATVAGGTTIGGATVVLDPGHGGIETGAVGPNGLVERDLNLAVALVTKELLEREGATVVLTRTADYRISLNTRAEIAQRLKPPVFISIHHNGGHDEERATPGTEVFFQVASPASRRLAGILYEELWAFFDGVEGVTSWYADRDAGAKYRLGSSVGDYYGILRRTNGITAVLSEAAFLANPQEAAVLADPEVQRGEAAAITRAVRRFMLSDDEGSGFVEPYPRTEPAGGGGGTDECVDPTLE